MQDAFDDVMYEGADWVGLSQRSASCRNEITGTVQIILTIVTRGHRNKETQVRNKEMRIKSLLFTF